jgi:hypothetical protein
VKFSRSVIRQFVCRPPAVSALSGIIENNSKSELFEVVCDDVGREVEEGVTEKTTELVDG